MLGRNNNDPSSNATIYQNDLPGLAKTAIVVKGNKPFEPQLHIGNIKKSTSLVTILSVQQSQCDNFHADVLHMRGEPTGLAAVFASSKLRLPAGC